MIINWENKTILLIDNSMLNCQLMSLILKKYLARIVCETDGRKAIGYIQNHKIDLILTELFFHDVNGVELVKRIRKMNKTVPIIAQTTLFLAGIKREFLNAGGNEYFSKPIDFEDFIPIVNDYLKTPDETQRVLKNSNS